MGCAVVNPTLLQVNVGDLGVRVNLLARQGADADRLIVRLFDSAGALIDISGASVAAQIRKTLADADAAAAFVVTVEPTEVRLDLPASVLALLQAGEHARDAAGLYLWDCRAFFADTTSRWLAWGELRLLQPVTR